MAWRVSGDKSPKSRSQRAPRARGEDPGALLPPLHRVISFVKRWMLGTHQGAIGNAHLQAYRDEFVFRFNRRKSSCPRLVFVRVLQLAFAHPVPLPRPGSRALAQTNPPDPIYRQRTPLKPGMPSRQPAMEDIKLGPSAGYARDTFCHGYRSSANLTKCD